MMTLLSLLYTFDIELILKRSFHWFIGLLLIFCNGLVAQSSDELFQQARLAAFDDKDYPTAIRLSSQALNQSPNYHDIRVFLGRVYTWSDSLELAKKEFEHIITNDPKNYDVYLAYTDMLYWNDNYDKALIIANKGLDYFTNDKAILLKKLKIISKLYGEKYASEFTDSLVNLYPNDGEIRQKKIALDILNSRNTISVGYEALKFSDEFGTAFSKHSWHQLYLAFKQKIPIGSLISRVNYVQKFEQSGLQFEADLYTSLFKKNNMYFNIGYSPDVPKFPKWRLGFSSTQSLPNAWELDLGFRYLKFSSTPTWIYTGALSKYFRNYYFSLRTYLVPNNNSPISKSISLLCRRYFGNNDEYWYITSGFGYSPANDLLLEFARTNSSYKIGVGVSMVIAHRNIIDVGLKYANEKLDFSNYRASTISGSFGWAYKL